VEHYQPHPTENPLLHPIDHSIRDLLMGDVSPPHKHVRTVEQFLRQALRGVIESGAFDFKIAIGKASGKRAVDPVRIYRPDRCIGLFVPTFVPDYYANCQNCLQGIAKLPVSGRENLIRLIEKMKARTIERQLHRISRAQSNVALHPHQKRLSALDYV
jgi:hypothetical protein